MRSSGFLTISFTIALAAAAAAQEGSVAGDVVAKGTLAPLPNALVTVQGSDRRAITDAAGRFRIDGVGGETAVLAVRRINFRPVVDTVRVGDLSVRLTLVERALELDAVVVTGTAGGTEQRRLGNAVSAIDAADVTQKAPVPSLQALLNGRAAGVVVLPATGAVGSGARIRLRGASSFSLSNEPLIYVDGIRVNNAPATGPKNQDFGSGSISRLNDINPDDIERIEIVKGPAAATLYGTEASNGVIQIITKRGAPGPARWTLTMRQGANFLSNPEGRFWVNYQIDTITGSPTKGQPIPLDIVERENALGHPIFRTGHLQQYDLGLSGGSERVRYFVGGGYERSKGAELSNDLLHYNGRVNVVITPSDKISLGVNVGYISGPTHLSAEAGFGGRVWSTVLANPRNLYTGQRGFHSGTPEEYDLLYHFEQGLERVTAGVQVSHQPLPWFHHRLVVGTDRTRESNSLFQPRIDSLVTNPVFGSDALGYKEDNERSTELNTVDYSATASFDLSPTLRSSTSVGGQYYRNATDSVFASGEVFPAPGLSAVSATTLNRQNAQDFLEDRTIGIYAQEQVGWRDRLFVTAGLRADDNSAFGANFNRVYYPKFSASWVVSDEPFWHVAGVDALRLRAAYGESGKQPQTYSAIRTYQPVTGPGDVAAVTPQVIGNPSLGPERGKEFELGFDASFFQDRAGLEFTYYNKKTTDAILQRDISPSLGYPGTQFFNAGAVRNQGIELLARARPYDRGPVSWDVTLNLATNSSKVLDLGTPGLQFVTAGSFLRHQVGYPIGSWFTKRIVSAQLDASGNAINVMCDDGKGGAMPCPGSDGAYGTGDDAPDVYLGRTTPSFEGSVGSTVTLFGRLHLYGLVDFKTGYRKIDGNTRVRCTFFGGRCRENFYPLEFDPKRIAAIQSSRNLVDFLIDDASFAKLREVSVTYTLPDRWAQALRVSRAAVSLAGRNLHTWTGYGGLEPEAMFLGGSRGGDFSLWEQTTLPQLTSWLVTLNVGF